MNARPWLLVLSLAVVVGCDRNVEPFVEGEQPRPPDLSKIFPEGAKAPPTVPGLPPGPGGGAPPVASGAQPITGEVAVAPELADRAAADGTLFVVVRRGEAGPPLAVKRIPSPRFPVQFEIGPDDRMIESMPFEGPFNVSARLDGDGNATTREAGDLSGALPAPVDPGARDLKLTLDQLL